MSHVKIKFKDDTELLLPNPYTLDTVENEDAGWNVVIEGKVADSFDDETDARTFENALRDAITEALQNPGGTTILVDIDDL